MLILDLPGLLQNQNLETILSGIVVLYFPNDKIVRIRSTQLNSTQQRQCVHSSTHIVNYSGRT